MEAPGRGQGGAREGPNFDPIDNLLLRHESRKVESGGMDRDGRNGRESGMPSYPPPGPLEPSQLMLLQPG